MKQYYQFGAQVQARAHAWLNKPVLQQLWHGFCCHSSALSAAEIDRPAFCIGSPDLPEPGNALYRLRVNERGIAISARDPQGLLRGYMALLDWIEVFETRKGAECFGVAYCDITASPAVQNRMIHYCVFPDTKLYEIQRFIRLCGVLQYTHIVLEFWGMLKLNALKELGWSHAFTKEEIRPLIREAHDLGIEIIPMLNHWGHATGSRVAYGKHVVLDQNLALQPLFTSDGWNWRIEKPEVRDLLRSIRAELMELCGEGGYFHLGCDESYSFHLTPENAHIVTDYLNEIAAELKKEGRRAIVWGDMLVAPHKDFQTENKYYTNCPDEAIEATLLSALSKDIVIADWQYHVSEAPVETALIFQKAGFDVLLCPWDESRGSDAAAACAKTVIDHNLFGVMHTTWHTLAIGMPELMRVSELCLNGISERLHSSYYRTHTAGLLRKVCYPCGEYERAGWAPHDITPILKL